MGLETVVTGLLLCGIFVGIPVMVLWGVHRDKRRQRGNGCETGESDKEIAKVSFGNNRFEGETSPVEPVTDDRSEPVRSSSEQEVAKIGLSPDGSSPSSGTAEAQQRPVCERSENRPSESIGDGNKPSTVCPRCDHSFGWWNGYECSHCGWSNRTRAFTAKGLTKRDALREEQEEIVCGRGSSNGVAQHKEVTRCGIDCTADAVEPGHPGHPECERETCSDMAEDGGDTVNETQQKNTVGDGSVFLWILALIGVSLVQGFLMLLQYIFVFIILIGIILAIINGTIEPDLWTKESVFWTVAIVYSIPFFICIALNLIGVTEDQQE